MKLGILTIMALSASLTQATAATVQAAGFGFRYDIATDGTPTGSTTVNPFGFPGSESDEATLKVSAIATSEVDNGSRVVQQANGSSGVERAAPTPQYAAIRGDLTKGEIGVATGVFSHKSSGGFPFLNESDSIARSGGLAQIGMHDQIRVDLTHKSDETFTTIGFGADLDGNFGSYYNMTYGVDLFLIGIEGGHFHGIAGSNHSAGIRTQFIRSQPWAEPFSVSSGDGLVDFSDPYAPRGEIKLRGGYAYELHVGQSLTAVGQTSFLGTSGFVLDIDEEYTSASGAFLSANAVDNTPIVDVPIDTVTAVPVPAAGWALITGLAGLVALKRREKSASRST